MLVGVVLDMALQERDLKICVNEVGGEEKRDVRITV